MTTESKEYNYPRAAGALILLAATLLSQSGCGATLHKKLGGYTQLEDLDAAALVDQFRQLVANGSWSVLSRQSESTSETSRFTLQNRDEELIPSRHFELITPEGDILSGTIARDPEVNGHHCNVTLIESAQGGTIATQTTREGLGNKFTVTTHPGQRVGHLSSSEGLGFRLESGNAACQGGSGGGECVVNGEKTIPQRNTETANQSAQELCAEITNLANNTSAVTINDTSERGDTTVIGEMK